MCTQLIVLGHRKTPDSIVVGNNEESQGVMEISTNFINSGESFNKKTTIIDNNFSSKIAIDLQLIQNLSPWQSASSVPTGSNERKQSRLNCSRLRKERYLLQ